MEARVDRLLEASVPIDLHDPRWRLKADRRPWFVRHWPALVGWHRANDWTLPHASAAVFD